MSGPFISVFFSMSQANWLIIKEVIESIGLHGHMETTMIDGIPLRSELIIQINHILGPWLEGPFHFETIGGRHLVKNMLETPLELLRLKGVDEHGNPVEEVVKDLITEGASLELQQNFQSPVAYYEIPHDSGASIDERRVFAEEIERKVTFLLLASLANYQLTRIYVEARIMGVDQVESFQLQDNIRSKEISFLLPLTKNLETPLLRFSLIKEGKNESGEVELTPVSKLQIVNLESTAMIDITIDMLEVGEKGPIQQ